MFVIEGALRKQPHIVRRDDIDAGEVLFLHDEAVDARIDPEFGIARAYDDAAAMLAGERLDAVDIATWRATHADLIRLAASHVLDVLCQKPLAPTFEAASAVADEVAGRIRLMVHENRRFAPHFRNYPYRSR